MGVGGGFVGIIALDSMNFERLKHILEAQLSGR